MTRPAPTAGSAVLLELGLFIWAVLCGVLAHALVSALLSGLGFGVGVEDPAGLLIMPVLFGVSAMVYLASLKRFGGLLEPVRDSRDSSNSPSDPAAPAEPSASASPLMPADRGLKAFAVAPFLALCALGGSMVLAQLLELAGVGVHEQPALEAHLRAGPQTPGFWALAVSASLGAPLAEEFLFRRGLFHRLRLRSGRRAAYIFTALIFALTHNNLPGILIYAWLATVFAFAYERGDRVWMAVSVHAIHNAAAFALQALSLSGDW